MFQLELFYHLINKQISHFYSFLSGELSLFSGFIRFRLQSSAALTKTSHYWFKWSLLSDLSSSSLTIFGEIVLFKFFLYFFPNESEVTICLNFIFACIKNFLFLILFLILLRKMWARSALIIFLIALYSYSVMMNLSTLATCAIFNITTGS